MAGREKDLDFFLAFQEGPKAGYIVDELCSFLHCHRCLLLLLSNRLCRSVSHRFAISVLQETKSPLWDKHVRLYLGCSWPYSQIVANPAPCWKQRKGGREGGDNIDGCRPPPPHRRKTKGKGRVGLVRVGRELEQHFRAKARGGRGRG